MAFNDLSPQAQEGLNYAANQHPTVYTNGRDFMDKNAEALGLQYYQQKIDARKAARAAKLELAANAALAAQVDAAPST